MRLDYIFEVACGCSGGVVVIRLPHDSEVPSSDPARTILRIYHIEIHSVYQAVIGTGLTWSCGGMAQVVELLV